jgi:hypothetical protein
MPILTRINLQWVPAAWISVSILGLFSPVGAQETTAPRAGVDGENTALVGLVRAGQDPQDLKAILRIARRALDQHDEPGVMSAPDLSRRLGQSEAPEGPPLDLSQLEALFSEGHTLTYSFEYAKAVDIFQRLLRELERLDDSVQRWTLFVKANLWLGVAKTSLKDEEGSREAFLRVLKTRPGMVLTTREFAPRFIERFEQIKKTLADLPRGKIAVESEPPGAEIFADGAPLGRTPFIGELPHGVYSFTVAHSDAGTVVRTAEVGTELCRLSIQIAFESALKLEDGALLLRLPAGTDDLPVQWWPWLSARLGIRRLIALGKKTVEGRDQVFGILVDMTRYRREREGWLDPASPERLEQDLADLLRFLATGKAQGRLKVSTAGAEFSASGPAPSAKRLMVEKAAEPTRPWYRRWWTWAAGGAALALAGAGCHLGAVYWDQQAEKHTTIVAIEHDREIARTLRGIAIGGYAVGGLVLITGFILDPSVFLPPKNTAGGQTGRPSGSSLVLTFDPLAGGISLAGRF